MSEARSLKVVIVDEELPYPPNTGKRLRTYNLVIRLARRHRITFVCHRNGDEEEFNAAKTHFESLGILCRPIARKLPMQSVLSGGPSFYFRLVQNLISPRPYLVDKHRSQGMQTAIEHIERHESFDLWHCEWTPYAQFFCSPLSRPLVVAAHNIESLIWQRYYENESNYLKRWYIRKQWKKLCRFEQWAFSRATCTVAVSDKDAELVRLELGARRVDVVENGVDIWRYRPVDTRRIPTQLLFLGSLDWRPNLDGVIQFLDRAFPAIRRIEPQFRLQIVGRKPPEWLARRVQTMENVTLHADAPDVRPYLEQAGFLIVPLRIGGGSRLKILEASAMQLPVISTRIGAEGLHLMPGAHYILADSIAGMIEPVLNSIRCYEECQSMAAAAYRQVQYLYNWDTLAEKLERVWHGSLHPQAA